MFRGDASRSDASKFSSLRMRDATEVLRKAAVDTSSPVQLPTNWQPSTWQPSKAAGTTTPSAGFSLGSSGQSQEGSPKKSSGQSQEGSPKILGWPFGKQQQAQAEPARPPAASFCDPDVDIRQQVAEWDSEIDYLDRKENQVRGDQWKVMRVQMASLMGAVADIRTELLDIKENAVMKSCWPDVECVIEDMVSAHDEHGKKEDILLQRITHLEEYIGESADKQQQELENVKNKHREQVQQQQDHMATVETRLKYVERLLGDSVDKHSADLEATKAQLGDLHLAISGCAKVKDQVDLGHCVDYIEKFLDADGKHAEHLNTVEIRLLKAQGTLGDLEKAVSECARAEHHSKLELRVESLEKQQVQPQPQPQPTTLELRVESLEKQQIQSQPQPTVQVRQAQVIPGTAKPRGVSPGPSRVGSLQAPPGSPMNMSRSLQVPPGSPMNISRSLQVPPGSPMNISRSLQVPPGSSMNMPEAPMSVPQITPLGSPLNPKRGSFKTITPPGSPVNPKRAMQPPGGYTVVAAPCAVRSGSLTASVTMLPPAGSSVSIAPGATSPIAETGLGASTPSQTRSPTLAIHTTW